MSTSLRFKILRIGIGLMGAKKLFALPKDALLKKVAVFNKKRAFRMPADREIIQLLSI